MSVKESELLRFNGISWRASHLGETVILLQGHRKVPIEKIHESTQGIEKILGDKLNDIVPTYHSIAVFTPLSIDELFHELQNKDALHEQLSVEERITELPICYELGMDLERVAQYANLSVDQLISLHLAGVYRSLFIGFIPGFIYADGLHEKINCPRLDNPRKKIYAGSVGIAGNQTGIYSLPSPGGWNIIGRTPTQLFNSKKSPPMRIGVGSKYKFYRIKETEFESWES